MFLKYIIVEKSKFVKTNQKWNPLYNIRSNTQALSIHSARSAFKVDVYLHNNWPWLYLGNYCITTNFFSRSIRKWCAKNALLLKSKCCMQEDTILCKRCLTLSNLFQITRIPNIPDTLLDNNLGMNDGIDLRSTLAIVSFLY